MNVEIKPATLRDLTYIGAHARFEDERELIAAGPKSAWEAAVITWFLLQEFGGSGWCAWADGEPQAAFGVTRQGELQPWLFSAWAWGTERMPLVMPRVTLWGYEHARRILRELGAKRVEIRSIGDHVEAHRWIRHIGFVHECSLPQYGKAGETFEQFGWTPETPGRDQCFGGAVHGGMADLKVGDAI